MKRHASVIVRIVLLGLLAAIPARAQTPPANVGPGQARAALDVLKDDAARARLITVLEAIAGSQPPSPTAIPPEPPAKKPALALAPDSIGAQLLYSVSDRLSDLSSEVVDLAQTVTDFPLLWAWFHRLATDGQTQRAIFSAVWRAALVLGFGLGAEWVARRLLRGVIAGLRARAPLPSPEIEARIQAIEDAEAGHTEWTRRRASVVNLARRLPYAAAAFVLDLLPVLAVIATGYALLAAGLAGGLTTRLVILAVLNALVIWRLIVAVARAVASPDSDRLRLIRVDDDQARVIVREVAWVSGVAVAGYAITESALLFGLFLLAHDALLKLNALIVYVLVMRIVLRNRRGLKNALRARDDARGVFAGTRNVLASAWHRIIIFYLGALWLVWAFDVQHGFSRLLRVMLSTVFVSIAARLLSVALDAGLVRLLGQATGVDERYPGMEQRLAGYLPLARGLVNATITLVALVLLFEAWGFDTLSWFETASLGHRLISTLATIAATLVLALAVWELVNAAIARHLAQLARNAQLARSARLRTLLPMFRTTLLVTVCLIAGLVVLSEIGLNIAPLLAGAGVIGIAIGFGSQKLVQDIITGLFLLLENAMQVGDVVTLGGMTGTVENLSIRTIRLRALDGAVHIVPFSAVTTVTNNTRDYGYALIDLSVGLNEEPDRVADVLRNVAAKLRDEAPWRGLVLADLEVMGIEKFIDTAWVMRVRLKTLPASRWAVGRELNRRIKYRFDELAIESPITSYRVLSMAQAPAAVDNVVVKPA